MRLERGEQLLAGLGLERLADVNLAHSLECLFRKRAREHHQRPGEVRPVGMTQLQEPGEDRSRLPDDRSPPGMRRAAEVELPALHDELPLQRRELASLGDDRGTLPPRTVTR